MYTKGPWTIARHTSGQPQIETEQVKTTFGKNRVIALVYQGLIDSESEANAKLIASAPELLEACKTARFSLELTGEADRGLKWLWNELNKAIAKAEGK